MFVKLPLPGYAESAQVLHRFHLQSNMEYILRTLEVLRGAQTSPMRTMPSVLLWKNYTDDLENCGVAMMREWERRGYRQRRTFHIQPGAVTPWWLGDPALHASHRASLLVKFTEWYGQFSWTEEPSAKFMWPEHIRSKL